VQTLQQLNTSEREIKQKKRKSGEKAEKKGGEEKEGKR